MKGLHNAYHIVEDDDSLPLAQPLLLDDVMLEINQIRRLIAEVVGTQAVEHEADPFFHLAHFVGFQVLHYFVGSILRKTMGGWGWVGVIHVLVVMYLDALFTSIL